MASTRHGSYAARFGYAGPTNLDLVDIMGWSLRPGGNRIDVIPAGALSPGATILNFADPMAEIQTGDLTTVLGAVNIATGLSCTGGATLQLQKRSDASTFTGSGTHRTITSAAGFLMIRDISAEQDSQQGAVCNLVYYPFSSDGITVPFALNASQSLVTTPAFTSKFFLGPVYYNSSEVEGIHSVRVESGIEFHRGALDREGGDLYNKTGFIRKQAPKVVIRTLDFQAFSTLTNLFATSTSSTFLFYFRKGATGPGRVADASTVHAKITATASVSSANEIRAMETDDASLEIAIDVDTTLSAVVNSAIA